MLDDVLASAARLQEIVRSGCSWAVRRRPYHAGHRESFDHDHVLADLAERYAEVVEAVEQRTAGSPACAPAPPLTLLGSLDGVRAGLRPVAAREPSRSRRSASAHVSCAFRLCQVPAHQGLPCRAAQSGPRLPRRWPSPAGSESPTPAVPRGHRRHRDRSDGPDAVDRSGPAAVRTQPTRLPVTTQLAAYRGPGRPVAAVGHGRGRLCGASRRDCRAPRGGGD